MSTLITNKSIITEIQVNNYKYAVFTAHMAQNFAQFESIINCPHTHQTLIALHSENTTDAVCKHIALSRMLATKDLELWNTPTALQLLPLPEIRKLHNKGIFAKNDTLNSTFTKKLFSASKFEQVVSEITSEIADFVIGLLFISAFLYTLAVNTYS